MLLRHPNPKNVSMRDVPPHPVFLALFRCCHSTLTTPEFDVMWQPYLDSDVITSYFHLAAKMLNSYNYIAYFTFVQTSIY